MNALAAIRSRSLLIRVLCATMALPVTVPGQSRGVAAETLRIVVVEGGGAINNISARTARDPVVRVQSAEGKPVSGATVTFTLPSAGPGGTFLDGNQTTTVRTGPDGLATARGLKPNKNPGQFPIRVLASFEGQVGRTTVFQTNAAPAKTGSRSKKIVIAGLVAGAVAGGVLAASHGGKSSAATIAAGSVAPPAPGSPTFIPPH